MNNTINISAGAFSVFRNGGITLGPKFLKKEHGKCIYLVFQRGQDPRGVYSSYGH